MTVTIQNSTTLAGIQFSENVVITGEVPSGVDVALAPAKNGTLTTRTSDTVGTLTMSAGHGIIDADRLDIYWDGGSRRGVLVGTVATNSVPFTGGDGDILPAAATIITAMVPIKRTFSFDGDDLKLFLCGTPDGVKGTFVLVDDANVELYAVQAQGGAVNRWFEKFLPTNPLVGVNPFEIWISHGDSTATRSCKAAFLV